jgi:hypothetical protein
MPLQQYFIFVGGSLLILLFAANWLVPLPASNELINSDVSLPVIRIHSELKGPEAVVIDTSESMIRPILAAHEDTGIPQTVIPSEWTLNKAFAGLDAPLRPQAGANEQNKREEGQQQTRRKFVGARPKRRPILIDRSVEPDATAFRVTFAQLVPRLPKQAGRNEPKARRPISAFNHGW